MPRRQSQIIESAERPVLPHRSRSSGDIAVLLSGYSPGDEAEGVGAGAHGQETSGSGSGSTGTAARAAQGLSGAQPLALLASRSPGSPRSPPAKLTKLPASPIKPPAMPAASAGRFSRANRDKGRSAYKRFMDVFTGASAVASRGGVASAPTSPAKARGAALTLLPPPPSAPPLSPNPATLGQHYHSMPSSPDLTPEGEQDQMATVLGRAGHRISLFDALGAVPVPPTTPTTSIAAVKLKVPTVDPVPFPSLSTLTKDEHARMVTAAEEERARRADLRKQAWFKVPPGQALRDRDHKLPMNEAPYW